MNSIKIYATVKQKNSQVLFRKKKLKKKQLCQNLQGTPPKMRHTPEISFGLHA